MEILHPPMLIATIFSADGIIDFERNSKNFIVTLICIYVIFALPLLLQLAWKPFSALHSRFKTKESPGGLVHGAKEIVPKVKETDKQLVPRKATMCTKIVASLESRTRHPGLIPRAGLLEKHNDVNKPFPATTRDPREPAVTCQALPQMSSEDLKTALELAGGNHLAAGSAR